MINRILYIEPNSNHQKIILKLITSAEHSAVTLKYVFSAKFLLKNIVPSLIIIGHGVPENNTLELVTFLKMHPSYKNIKLLKLNPSINKAQHNNYIEKGVDNVINLTELTLFVFMETIRKLVGDINEIDNKINTMQFAKETIKPQIQIFNGLCNKNLDDQENIISSQNLFKRLKKTIQAKAIPFVVSEILTLTSFVNSDFNDLIDIIKLDPALTVKVLKCANSSCYRGNMPRIYSLADAVRVIGMNGLKNLVLGISILDSFQYDKSNFKRFKIWYHSIVTGIIAKEIAKLSDIEDIESMFIMGMLHDIGTSIFEEYFPKEYKEVLNIVYEREMPLNKAEDKLLGYNHGQIASYILESWGFNNTMISPIANHCESISKIMEMNSNIKKEALILKLADILANNIGRGFSAFEEVLEVPNRLLLLLDITPDEIDEILKNVIKHSNELIQVMFLHLDTSLLDQCNDLDIYKSPEAYPILFYSYKASNKDYFSYETILKNLNYNVTKPKNLYSITDLNEYKFSIFDFSSNCSPSECINFFKSIKEDYGNTLKVCALISKNLYNSIYNDPNLPEKITFLIKPFSLKDIATMTTQII